MNATVTRRRLFALAALAGLSLVATSAAAAVNVRVQPSGDTPGTAYTLINEGRTYFGNVEGSTSGTYTCQWNINGAVGATFSPANPHYITVDQTFATAGGRFLQLTCWDTANNVDTDTGTINVTVVSADNPIRQKNSLIDNGLRWIYQSQVSSPSGCFSGSGYWTASTGMALIAMENHGHNLQSSDEDIYKPVLAAGLQCMMDNYAASIATGDQTCIGDPEMEPAPWDLANDDGLGIYFQTHNQYYTPFVLMAIVNSSDEAFGKAQTVISSNAVVNGKTLWEIAREVKDYLAWSQTDYTCSYAGWRYNANDSSIDNSVNQWPVLALKEAEDRWNIRVNPTVKDLQEAWLAPNISQAADGSFGYNNYYTYNNVAKTAAGIIGLNWVGRPVTDPAVQSALTWINGRYSDVGCTYWGATGHFSCFYPMYGFFKAMKLYEITDFNGHDWEADYAANIIANSGWDAGRKASYINSSFSYFDQPFNTYVGVAMLAEEVAALPPVAEAGTYPNDYAPAQQVHLDASASYHLDSGKAITLYQWDFNAADGLWWNSAPTPPAGQGALGVTANFNLPPYTGNPADYPRDQIVTLRVLDNGSPQMTDTDTASIHIVVTNASPVALTNGPWAGIPYFPNPTDPSKCQASDPNDIFDADCNAVEFDGSTSYDPNSGPPINDAIVGYAWDIDGDGSFNEANGDDGWPVVLGDYSVVRKIFNAPSSGLAILRVTDTFASSGTSSAQFVSIALAYATDYRNCWSVRTSRFTERRGIGVTVTNIGDKAAQNLVLTLKTVPTTLTIVSGVANIGAALPGGSLNAGASKETACSIPPAPNTADIVNDINLRVPATGVWTWQAEFDADGIHYVIPNLPALRP